jgi:hypothetical protein
MQTDTLNQSCAERKRCLRRWRVEDRHHSHGLGILSEGPPVLVTLTYNDFIAQQIADYNAAILRATKTFPPAGATNYCPALDLWAAKHPQDGSEKFSVRVTLPASPSLANVRIPGAVGQ